MHGCGIANRFSSSLGPNAIEQLQVSYKHPDHRIITISGDQCTGKSTLTKKLGALFHAYDVPIFTLVSGVLLEAKTMSAGSVFRAEAARQGISVAALAKKALNDETIGLFCSVESEKIMFFVRCTNRL
jgi:hypothetical protein